jgi:hypothetical protein
MISTLSLKFLLSIRCCHLNVVSDFLFPELTSTLGVGGPPSKVRHMPDSIASDLSQDPCDFRDVMTQDDR